MDREPCILLLRTGQREIINSRWKRSSSAMKSDDAAAVLASIDVAHSIFILVSKSGTTLETLTNESFVKDALKNAGLDASKHMIGYK